MKKKLIIDGMHCENCARAVKEALSEDIDGIEVLKVNLKKKTVDVDMEDDVDVKQLEELIDEIGFKLVEIRDAKSIFGS